MFLDWLKVIFAFFWASAPNDLPSCADVVGLPHFRPLGLTCPDVPQLGEGAQAKVYLVERQTGAGPTKLVLKIQKVNSRDRREGFDRERDILSRAAHPNIVALVDATVEGDFGYSLLEHGEAGTLRNALERFHDTYADPKALLVVFLQLLDAVGHLHRDLKVVHADIKDTNVVMAAADVPKLIDFDLSVPVGSRDVGKGTSGWMDPVFFTAEEDSDLFTFDEKTDVYSLGVVLFQMFHGGDLPFGRAFEYRRRVRNGTYKVREGLPLEVVYALNGCLQAEPAARMTFARLDQVVRSAHAAAFLKTTKEALELNNWQGPPAFVAEAVERGVARHAEALLLGLQLI